MPGQPVRRDNKLYYRRQSVVRWQSASAIIAEVAQLVEQLIRNQ